MSNIHKYDSSGKLVDPWEDGFYSVTTILDVRNKPKLWEWKMRVGYEEANKRMLESQEKGTTIHLIAENYFNKANKPNDPDYDYALAAIKDWENKFQPEIIATERYLVSDRYKYAGTADLICKLKDEVWIVDFKTGAKSIDHGLQLAAYRQAYKDMTGIKAKTAGLYLNNKTKRGWSWKEYNETIGVFVAAKKLFDWQIKKEPIKKSAEVIKYDGGLINV
jgi:predicted RecB family nuclease